jgi:D-alanine transaminase
MVLGQWGMEVGRIASNWKKGPPPMELESLACLNGDIMPADRARVPINDRGFLLGDAIYEVFRAYRGRCWLEADHMARLRRSLQEMMIGGVDLDRLRERIHRTLAASGISEGTVYIQITRGVAPRRHAFPGPDVPPLELIVIKPYDDTETVGLRESGVATISYPDLRWRRCDVKSTNLLPNCLANEAAHRAGAYEAILIGHDGRVTEATHSSLLWVRGGRLEATPEGSGILPGTTRLGIHRIAAAENLEFVEATLTLEELKAADEVILTGTTIEVLPVIAIDDAAINGGQPGPIARRLQNAFRRAVDAWLANPSPLSAHGTA